MTTSDVSVPKESLSVLKDYKSHIESVFAVLLEFPAIEGDDGNDFLVRVSEHSTESSDRNKSCVFVAIHSNTTQENADKAKVSDYISCTSHNKPRPAIYLGE